MAGSGKRRKKGRAKGGQFIFGLFLLVPDAGSSRIFWLALGSLCWSTSQSSTGSGAGPRWLKKAGHLDRTFDLSCAGWQQSMQYRTGERKTRKRAESRFESTVSEERTHWVLRQTRWVCLDTQAIGWEEPTELSPCNSVSRKSLTEFGVWNRALQNCIPPVSEKEKKHWTTNTSI